MRSPFGQLYPSIRSTRTTTSPFGRSSRTNPFKVTKSYTPAASPPKPKAAPKKSGGGGIGGFLGGVESFGSHLLNDAEQTVRGLPTGVVHLVQHPVGSLENIGKSTWQDWSPLFHSEYQVAKAGFHGITGNEKAALHDLGGAGHDFKKFGHQFYEHPLSPILDVASVFTGGASLAGKTAHVLAEAGDISRGVKAAAEAGRVTRAVARVGLGAKEGSKLDRLGKFSTASPVKYTHSNPLKIGREFKTTSSNPLVKAGQLKVKSVLDKSNAPVVGRDARYLRREVAHTAGRAVAFQNLNAKLINAAKKLTGPNRTQFEEASLRHIHDQMDTHALAHSGHLPGTKKNGRLPANTENLYVKDASKVKFTRNPNKSFEEELNGRLINRGGKLRRAGGVSQKFTTRDPAKAARFANGDFKVVPRHLAEKYGMEAANSSKFIKTFVRSPLTVWKYMLLGYAPRFFVNNSVGNAFMYATTHANANGARSLAESMAHGIGQRRVVNAMVKAGTTKATAKAAHLLNPDWMDKHFADQLNGFAAASQHGMSKLAKYTAYPLVHKYSDQLFRRAALRSFMRAQPEVKAVMRSQKLSFDKAAEKALSNVDNGHLLRTRAQQHVMDVMGDYHGLNKAERAISAAMPFYTWNRHAMRYAKKLVRDHPERADLVTRVGKQGHDQTIKLLGHIPSWLENSIPGSMLGIASAKDRKSILSTAGINPLATVGDTAQAAAALTDILTGTKLSGKAPVGESISGSLNPFAVALIEHLSGHSLTTDAPVKGGSVVTDAFKNIPQLELMHVLEHGTPQPKLTKSGKPGKPFLFQKDAAQYLDSLLGLPIKQMSPKAAQSMYDKEQGIHHPRKRGTSTRHTKYKGF